MSKKWILVFIFFLLVFFWINPTIHQMCDSLKHVLVCVIVKRYSTCDLQWRKAIPCSANQVADQVAAKEQNTLLFFFFFCWRLSSSLNMCSFCSVCTLFCLLIIYEDRSKFSEAVNISTFWSAFVYLGRIINPSLYLSFNETNINCFCYKNK